MKRLHVSIWSCALLAAVWVAGCADNPEKTKAEAFARAKQYAEKRQNAEAIVEYRRAIQADPKFGEARKRLAKIYMDSGDYRSALAEGVRAADLLPNDVEAQLSAGNLLLAAGKFEDARTRADKVLAKAATNADAHVLRGNALAGLKNLDDALTEFENAAVAAPQNGLIHANIGFVQMARGSKADAEASFRKATEVSPNSTLARISYANFLFATNDAARAEEELKKALAIAPKDAVVQRALAVLYVSTNRAAEAEPHLKALADITNDPSARFALARFYFALNRRSDAMRELSLLASKKESYAEATIAIAAARYLEGQTAEAHRLLDDILKQFPTNAQAHLTNAQFLATERKWTEAAAAAKVATERDPRLASAFYVLGVAYRGSRDYANARSAFSEVLRLQPNATAAQVALAELHLLMRDTNTAQQLAAQAAAQAPQVPQVRTTLIKTLLANNELPAASEAIAAFKKDFPNREDPYVLEGTLHLIRKENDAAGRAFAKAYEIAPGSLAALTGRIQVLLATGRVNDVKQTLERLDIFNSGKPEYAVLAARTYAAVKDYGSAERLLRTAIERDASNSQAYGLLGQLYFMQNRLDDALREFQNVASREPKSIPAHTMVATILMMKNKRADAKAAYRTVLTIDQNSPVAANNLAWMMAEDGENLDDALRLAQTAKAGLPNDPNASDTLGWVYMKKGLAAQAVSEFKDALTKEPANADFKYRLGLAYAQTGEFTEARRNLESALAMNAKSAHAEEARATLSRLARLGS